MKRVHVILRGSRIPDGGEYLCSETGSHPTKTEEFYNTRIDDMSERPAKAVFDVYLVEEAGVISLAKPVGKTIKVIRGKDVPDNVSWVRCYTVPHPEEKEETYSQSLEMSVLRPKEVIYDEFLIINEKECSEAKDLILQIDTINLNDHKKIMKWLSALLTDIGHSEILSNKEKILRSFEEKGFRTSVKLLSLESLEEHNEDSLFNYVINTFLISLEDLGEVNKNLILLVNRWLRLFE